MVFLQVGGEDVPRKACVTTRELGQEQSVIGRKALGLEAYNAHTQEGALISVRCLALLHNISADGASGSKHPSQWVDPVHRQIIDSPVEVDD